MKKDLVGCLSVCGEMRIRHHQQFEEEGARKRTQSLRHFGNMPALPHLRISVAICGIFAYR
jgi:hypothetical protein